MAVMFNANEIFEIAIQIERNGSMFYSNIAKKSGDADIKKTCDTLSAMEKEHEKIFESMKQSLSGKEKELVTYDPLDEIALYLKAFADGRVFDLKEDPSAALAGGMNLRDILNKAIGLEKDSIVFYLGIRDLVPPALGKDKIEKILSEEMGHIRILSERLRAIK